ncbi:MAG: hypothetical protein ACREKN_00845 [Longimicrobiaceae bacterium]
MKRQLLAAAACALAILVAHPARAQTFAVELRAGGGVGATESSGAGLELVPRPSFGLTVSYAPLVRLAVYAGYSRRSFGCESVFCHGRGIDFTSSGPHAGVRFGFPLAGRPWLRAGVVVHHLEANAKEPPARESSELAAGFEAGAGLAFGLTRRVTLTPGIGYTRYSATFGDQPKEGVVLLVADVGLRISF